jgi:hypothetical protein
MAKSLFLAILILVTPVVPAQILSAYITYSPIHPSNVQTGVVNNQLQYTSYWASGLGGGVTFNFLPLHIINLGLDLRGSTAPGTPGADTALVGIKLSVHPPLLRLRPYIQGSGGYLGTRSTNVTPGAAAGTTVSHNNAAWEILGGIDYPLMHFLDFRAIEIGGGKAIGSSSNPSLFTINTGLVVHF